MGLSKQIAYRLQTLRAAAGLSQEAIAEKADLSLSLVAKMEQARKADPRASTLIALAGALGVRPGELIEDLVDPPEGAFPSKKEKKKEKKKGKKLREALVGAGGELSVVLAPSANGHKDEHKKKKKKDK
ncbi:helix-turn-helix protein [Gemmata obscuriglobus]|uniref:XRE family transcriptional regulator n=1 Tax=Gemmata obscuriglobus TaxID=114 RepID=A0A2Z3H8N3_9BACT|nr:helix-turn-helix transcriptional regulator [Gemmata obscuriglobus]AWM39897.1 XRE family transcriptional regulator [Gemmata obscuriglobus]QEG26970.1 helix-turn-helix protein [Gemmata obscuriglobus]VTS03200.1 dna-binding protein : : HTH_31 [Gemmata obscuriglobus UQM 2246]